MSTPEPSTLEEALKSYREDSDFRVRKINANVWGMEGIIIAWKVSHRAIYQNHIGQILKLGKFEKFMVTVGKNGSAQVWFYNNVQNWA